jgi:hypothetical protein
VWKCEWFLIFFTSISLMKIMMLITFSCALWVLLFFSLWIIFSSLVSFVIPLYFYYWGLFKWIKLGAKSTDQRIGMPYTGTYSQAGWRSIFMDAEWGCHSPREVNRTLIGQMGDATLFGELESVHSGWKPDKGNERPTGYGGLSTNECP